MRVIGVIAEALLAVLLAAGIVWAIRERVELADKANTSQADYAYGNTPAMERRRQAKSLRRPPQGAVARNPAPAPPATSPFDALQHGSPANGIKAPIPEENLPKPGVSQAFDSDGLAAENPKSATWNAYLERVFSADPVALAIKTGKLPVTIRIGLVGDVDIPWQVKDKIAKDEKYGVLSGVASVINKLDVLAGNLEAPLTNATSATLSKTEEAIEEKKEFLLKDDPKYARNLKRAGFRVLSVANNHSMDFGWEGLKESLLALNNAGIAPVGGGADEKSARAPRFIEVKGKKLGFLAYTATIPAGYAAGSENPGVAAGRGSGTASLGFTYTKKLSEEVRAAKARCDFLIVSFHWGREKSPQPDKLQREIAQVLANAGADAVFGHGPHVLQPVEMIAGCPVAYSLGDFIWHNEKETGILELTLVSGDDGKLKLASAIMHGCKITGGAPKLTGGSRIIFPARLQTDENED